MNIIRERSGPINIGHRGAAALEPENTLRSFRRARAEGADAIELDLRLSSDRHLVLMHDATVDRTTSGSGEVARMTLGELRELDAGLGERIPTFEEVLEAVDLPVQAELKVVEAARPLAALIRKKDLGERIMPISFSTEALGEVRRVLPGREIGLILSDAPEDAARRARAVGASLVSLRSSELSAGVVEKCKGESLVVTAWTVNEPGEMRRVIGYGVDGIATDRPDLLSRELGGITAG